jgi:hypothetical protein
MNMAESSPLFGFDPSATTVVGNYSKVAEAQGDIADAAAQSKSQQAPFDFLGVGKQVAGIAATMAEEKNMVDAHQAKLRATEFMQNNDHLSGHELSRKIEQEIKSISEGDNFSTGYQKGALAVFDVGYAQALERKEEERVAASLNVVASNFSTQLADNKANNIPMTGEYAQTWATNTAAKMRLPVEYVRNAMVSSYYQDAQMRIVTARNKNELAAAQTYINEAGNVLRTPLFLDTRSKKFQPVVTKLKKDLDASITAKKKEFKEAAALVVETDFIGGKSTVWDTYPKDPTTPAALAIIRESVSSDAAYVKKVRELTNGYEEAQIARDEILSFDPYAIKPPAMTKEENKYFLPEAEKMVYAEVYKNLGKPDAFIDLVRRNPETISYSGDRLVHAFDTTEDPTQLAQMGEAFRNIQSFPGGSQSLQMALGDDYKRVISTMVIADSLAGGDIQKAKTMVAESSGALVQGSLEPDLKERMYENSNSLGTLGDEYIHTVNTLLNVNAGLVDKKMLDKVYDQFAEGYQEREGVNFDVSKFDTSSQAYDEDVFNEQIVETMTRLNGGVTPMSVRNLRNNIMTYTDEFGFPAGAFNANPALNIGNKLYEAMAIRDEKEVDFWTRSGDTFDVMTSYFSYAIPNTFNTDGLLAKESEVADQLAKVWSGADVPKEKIGKDILALKAMFPDVISKEEVPDYDVRKNLEERNIQMQALIESMATKFIGRDINTVIEEENMSMGERRRKYRHGR